MTEWSPADLDAIGGAGQIRITTRREDGSLRSYVPIWVVRVGDALIVRSYRGGDGSWYRHARHRPHGRVQAGGVEREVRFTEAAGVSAEDIDRAYRSKYGDNGYVDTMVGPGAAATTLRLAPAE